MLKMFEHLAALGFDGSQLDLVIQAGGGNFITSENPVLAVPMATTERLVTMLNKADYSHMYIAGGVFHINALYKSTLILPTVRIYYLKTENLSQLANWIQELKLKNIDLLKLPILDDERFSQKIEIEEYPQRYVNWKIKRNNEHGDFNKLADGRNKNTTVKRALWLNTTTCFFCKKPAYSIHTLSMSNSDEGVMMGVRVCEEHQNKIELEGGLLEAIENKFDLPKVDQFALKEVVDFHSAFDMNCQAIREKLFCAISEVNGNTIKCHRPSGVRIVFRLDAPDNYAYNIDYPNGNQHSRIDSARNHHVVNFGPDHIHRKLTRKQKNKVETSYTYGHPFLDYEVILELIEDAEKVWCNRVD